MRSALIVATAQYTDPGLRMLRAPAQDAEALGDVLRDPAIGGFTVRTLLDQPAHVVTEAVEEFFDERARDDLLLVHFSCHGIRDEDGALYFAATNTKLRRLGATAVPAEFVNRKMDRSRSRRIVLLLDCCYAGAFGGGTVARAGTGVAIEGQLGGQGRAVITASSALEYAFEAGELAEGADPQPSVFTSALVEGLASGEADRDLDGRIALDELYDYVYDRVREVTPHQTPGKWTFGVEGELYLARRGRPVTTPSPLPATLQEAAEHPLPAVRAGAVEELGRMARASHPGMALGARRALERLRDDDSRSVSAAAAAALELVAGQPATVDMDADADLRATPAAVAPPAPPPTPEGARAPAGRPGSGSQPAPVPVEAAEAPFSGQLAITGAVLLALGLFAPFQWGTALTAADAAVPEAASVVVLLAAAAAAAGAAALLPRTRAVTGPGLLLGTGTAFLWHASGLAAYWLQEDGQGFETGFWLQVSGLLLVAAAASGAARAVHHLPGARLAPRDAGELQKSVGLLSGFGALALLLQAQALWSVGFGWPDVAPALVAAALAVVVPLCAALLASRALGASVLAGWLMGAASLCTFYLQHTFRLRAEGYSDLSAVPALIFGTTLLALLAVAVLLTRAAQSGPVPSRRRRPA